MRLSDAIALGRTLIKPRRGGSPEPSQDKEGCALDMAALAIGKANWMEVCMSRYWPWLEIHRAHIMMRFDHDVMDGRMTLDQLIDWVRSIEPPEPDEAPISEQQPTVETAVEAESR